MCWLGERERGFFCSLFSLFFFEKNEKTNPKKTQKKKLHLTQQRRRQHLRVQGRRGRRRRRSHGRRRRGPPRAHRQQLDRPAQARAQARRDVQRERLLPPGDEARRRRRRRASRFRGSSPAQDAGPAGLPVLRRQANHRPLREGGRPRDAPPPARREGAFRARAGSFRGGGPGADCSGPGRPAASFGGGDGREGGAARGRVRQLEQEGLWRVHQGVREGKEVRKVGGRERERGLRATTAGDDGGRESREKDKK